MGVAAAMVFFRPDIPWKGGDEGILEKTFLLTDALGIMLLCLGWIIVFDRYIRYKADRFVALRTQLIGFLKATTAAAFWLLVISGVFSFSSITTLNIVFFWCVILLVGGGIRIGIRRFLMTVRRSGYNYRYLLVVGANKRSQKIASQIEKTPELGYKIVGYIAESEKAKESWESQGHENRKIIGMTKNLKEILEKERIDEIMVCLPFERHFSSIARTVRSARDLGIVARLLPGEGDVRLVEKLHVEQFEGEQIITLFRERMLLQLLVKRVADIVIAFIALIVLSPLLLAVAVIVRTTSPGPILFRQDRVGMNKRRFTLYKFRSMVADAEEQKEVLTDKNEMDGPVFKIRNDPRVTPIGRFIRKTSIDELPQLINVLCGEMSLVGPRPPLPSEVDQYEWLFRKRLSIKPGLTCVWQVSGRNDVSFKQWMEMDRHYIENWSLLLDLKILLKTVPTLLFGRGAS